MSPRRFASISSALLVGAIAALASYSHMRHLAVQYGQDRLIATLLPISVDGMMVVATAALGDGRPYRWSAWLAFWTGVAASVVANVLAAQPSAIARCISAWPAVAFLLVVEVITRGGRLRTVAPGQAVGVVVGVAPTTSGRDPDGAPATRPDEPVAADARTDEAAPKRAVTSGRTADGKRQATLDDVRLAVAAGTPATRDALGKRLRADGLSAGNGAVGELLRQYRTDERTVDGGRVNGHPVLTGRRS